MAHYPIVCNLYLFKYIDIRILLEVIKAFRQANQMKLTLSPPDKDGIVVVTMTGEYSQDWGTPAQEHRLNPDAVKQFTQILDNIEANPKAKALVLAGEGKFFSNGIDMAWIDYQITGKPREGGAMQQLSPETAR